MKVPSGSGSMSSGSALNMPSAHLTERSQFLK